MKINQDSWKIDNLGVFTCFCFLTFVYVLLVSLLIKQMKDCFLFSEHKSTHLGQLVRLDVWGPYKVRCREGFKIFLAIVDDLLELSGFFLLKGKDEVYNNIVNFVILIKKTSLVFFVKAFRSDNGT